MLTDDGGLRGWRGAETRSWRHAGCPAWTPSWSTPAACEPPTVQVPARLLPLVLGLLSRPRRVRPPHAMPPARAATCVSAGLRECLRAGCVNVSINKSINKCINMSSKTSTWARPRPLMPTILKPAAHAPTLLPRSERRAKGYSLPLKQRGGLLQMVVFLF